MHSTLERKETSENLSTKEKIKRLHDVMDSCFKCQMGGGFARSNERGFSGDAASLYSLIEINHQPCLVKVGWGEFSHQTFTSGQHPYLENSPLDLYCVSQSNSYFSNANQRDLMQTNPQEFLRQNALFVVTKKESNSAKIIPSQYNRSERSGNLDYGFPVENYENALCSLRNLALQRLTNDLAAISSTELSANKVNEYRQKFTNFILKLKHITSDLELGNFLIKIDHRPCLADSHYHSLNSIQQELQDEKCFCSLLIRLGIETCGCHANDPKSMLSIRELLSKYNLVAQKFTS